jgi:hypothetical protein
MKSGRQSGKVFYGWWIVAVVGIGVGLGYAPTAYSTFGIFLKSLSQEFNWSRTQVSLAATISLLVLSFSQPICGRLVVTSTNN